LIERTAFPGYTSILPVGADVRESVQRGPDEVPVTHRLDIRLPGDQITVLSTYRPDFVASHVGWQEVLDEKNVQSIDQIEGQRRFPFAEWGALERSCVYVRPTGGRLGAFNAISSDWVLDVLVELDESGNPSALADAFLRSIEPEPEPPLTPEEEEELEELRKSYEVELPGPQQLEMDGTVEFLLAAYSICFDVVDVGALTSSPPEDRPSLDGHPTGVWGSPSWRRIRTLHALPFALRVRWRRSVDDCLRDAYEWEHVVATSLDVPSSRVAIVPDVDELSERVEVALPASGLLSLVVRTRGLMVPYSISAVEYELLLSPEPGPDVQSAVVNSGMLFF